MSDSDESMPGLVDAASSSDESDADETTCFGGQRQREPGSVEMGELPTLSNLNDSLPPRS